MVVSDSEKPSNDSNLDVKSTEPVGAHNRTITLEILQIIKEAQQKHGLRHGDYQRYRGYCSRRLRRLRKSLHFVQGSKHRFQPKKVTEENLVDLRYLYIPLMLTERAWSYAMQLRQEANTEPRKRFHLVSRLKKACVYAKDLEELCSSSRCDARTKLEAQAYAAYLKGTLQFELQEWQAAMESYHKAQTIYEKLSEALTEDERILYKQRVDELTPNLRYCAYNIGDESAISDLMQMRLEGKTVAAELDQLIAQTREKQACTLSEVTWLGRTIPVRQEKVRLFLLNAQESEEEVSKAPDTDAKIAVYERLMLECKDALQLLRDELKADQASKSRLQSGDGNVTSLQFLHSYVVYIRQRSTIQRNLLLIDTLKQNLDSEGKKVAKPQDLIRPYEIIIQNLTEMAQLPGVAALSNFVEQVQSEAVVYKAHRTYYIAQTLTAASRWPESMALYQRASAYVSQALASGNLDKKVQSSLKDLQALIEGQKYSVHAQSILGSAEAPSAPEKDTKILSERLDRYLEDKSLTSRQPRIATFPPEFEPIPCKPLFFDLALNHVEFPSLEDVMESKKGGGITGFVRGWLGGWKK